MVQYSGALDQAFAAVSDPTRRGILERLGRGDASISNLAADFEMTLTGIKKHVRVLEGAGLVTTEKVGRVRTCRVGPRRLADEVAWIGKYQDKLDTRLTRLGAFLDPERKTLEIRIARVFDAPRDRVWRAFTDPTLVAQWWGRGNKLVIERMDVVQTFEWDGMPGHVAVETATFEDLGDGRTKVVNTTRFHSTEERDGMLNPGMEQDLNESYAALDTVLAKLGAPT